VISADVVVVGAGPAGSAAAITLARGGLDVVLVDKARFPRDKCCGDGLTTMALRRLADLGLEPERVTSWSVVCDVHLRAPGGRVVDLSLPAGPGVYAAVARRTDFDAALVDLARTAGARVIEETALRGATQATGRVVVDFDRGLSSQARYVIGADGMWSPLRKALGLADRSYRGDWHAFRQYITAPGEASRDMWVWFEPDLLPGYAWSFPLPGGLVNVGFGTPRRARLDGAALARTWRHLLGRDHLTAVLGPGWRPEAPHRAWPIPARLPSTRLADRRALFVGDAAAATDPLTGEGIGQALETGILAAQAVLRDGSDQPDLVARTYTRWARRALVADHRMAAGLSAVLRSRRATDAALAVVDRGNWTRSHFARWMFEDEPRAAGLTPRRWHRRFLHRPGAALGGPAIPV
jgi:menaquinone-9 beta-reductase